MSLQAPPPVVEPAQDEVARIDRVSRHGGDLGLLTLLIALLVGIPSILTIGPLGSAGTPADVLGLAMLVLWTFRRVARHGEFLPNPVRIGMSVLVASAMASYIAAASRPIAGVELSAADRGLLSMAAWLGIVLVAADGPRDRKQLDTLLRRLVIAGAALATLGLLQFATKQSFVNYIQIPGLRDNGDLSQLSDRSNLTRPPGTAIHPIEFGAALTMILPFALHYAVTDRNKSLLRRWYPVAAIGAAVPIAISRSAIISATVALLVLLPAWPKAYRRRVYAGTLGLLCCMYLVVHGLFGTLISLFTHISSDTSAQSRTDSYALADQFIGRSPVFGRGFRTFLPSYRILDNQLLGTTIEMGIVGLAALVGLMLTAIVACHRIRRQVRDESARRLAQAFMASIAAAGFGFAFYDGLSFPMAAGLFFLVVGCSGALIRHGKTAPPSSQTLPDQRLPRPD